MREGKGQAGRAKKRREEEKGRKGKGRDGCVTPDFEKCS
jgi:hypothetical protein